MNSWKVIPTIVLATVLIFGSGVFTGGILVNYAKQGHPRPAAKKTMPSGQTPNGSTNTLAIQGSRPPALNREFFQQLVNQLNLSKEQQEAVWKIITDGQYQMRKVVQDARLEIRDALSPEQQEQFDRLVKRPFRKPLWTNAPPSMVSTNTTRTDVR